MSDTPTTQQIDSPPPALLISNLKKTYDNGFIALKGIDLCIQQGDFFALLGANGAGKSTTIEAICSLVNKTAGSIEIFGHNIDSERDLAKSFIGLVPQEFNFNIFEPVIEIIVNQAGYYGIERKEAFRRAEVLLKRLDLWGKRKEKALNLSGGMKRRLMIARALIHKPQLLILDEPTAGVDIEIRRTMWAFLSSLNAAGTTIILTTHYLEEAENFCHNIAILDKGEVIENTSMKQLLSRLQTEKFVLNLKEPLSELPQCNDFIMSLRDSNTLEVALDKGRSLNLMFEFFSKHNIRVMSMRNKNNRLEELFMGLIDNNKGVKT
ncbi:MAG: ABC transporter ATP-binding protein [Aquificaceae bacterium]|nr:MAG: ABC transporter ATP-binding protein [Aquificaceae bacterium]